MKKWALLSSGKLQHIEPDLISLLIRADGVILRGQYFVNTIEGVKKCDDLRASIQLATAKVKYPGSITIWESAIKFVGGVICSEVQTIVAQKPDVDFMVEIIAQLEDLKQLTELEKASNDPHTAVGYQKYIRALIQKWQTELGAVEGEYLDAYIDRLSEVDWSKKSDKYIQAEFDILANFIPPCVLKVLPKIQTIGSKTSIEIAIRTRETMIEAKGFDVEMDFNLKDTKAIKNLGSMGSKQMPMTFMKLSAVAANTMKNQLIAGLDEGLNYKVVVADVIKALPEKVSKVQKNYLEVTAQNVLARARSYGQLATYQDAGIKYIKASSVLDERTTPFCRFIDGQILSVEPMFQYYNQAVAQDADPREAFPWVKEKTDKTSGVSSFSFQDSNGKNQTFATGTDGNYSYKKGWNSEKIQGFGVFPPYHARCRTTTYYDSEI
jgi:hypothetical protein